MVYIHGMSSPTALPPLMTDVDLRAALATLGISQVALGRRLGVGGASVRRWVAEGGKPPGPVAVLVHLLLARPELVAVLDFGEQAKAGRKARA